MYERNCCAVCTGTAVAGRTGAPQRAQRQAVPSGKPATIPPCLSGSTPGGTGHRGIRGTTPDTRAPTHPEGRVHCTGMSVEVAGRGTRRGTRPRGGNDPCVRNETARRASDVRPARYTTRDTCGRALYEAERGRAGRCVAHSVLCVGVWKRGSGCASVPGAHGRSAAYISQARARDRECVFVLVCFPFVSRCHTVPQTPPSY